MGIGWDVCKLLVVTQSRDCTQIKKTRDRGPVSLMDKRDDVDDRDNGGWDI